MSTGASGMALLDKPADITSFSALHTVKRALGIRKVGHAGTLDKFATGLLIVLAGPMTRLVPEFMGMAKTYEAEFEFGRETDTLDPTGETIAEADVPDIAAIREHVPRFTGEIEQLPPAFSAVHVNGRRAHELARAGKAVHVAPRIVNVHRFEILGWEPPLLRVRVECSKGTYIRSLARDLGRAASSRGHVRNLRRTAIGDFNVAGAVLSTEFTASDLVPPGSLFSRLPGIVTEIVEDRYVDGIRNGVPPRDGMLNEMPEEGKPVALFDGKEEFLALAEKKGGRYGYRFVAER